ncbi:MAG: hypothetical protein MZV70_77240 [Desulfobacterales bacterium]|nr:hypothetical protein [Desulfobacterales bacterium]
MLDVVAAVDGDMVIPPLGRALVPSGLVHQGNTSGVIGSPRCEPGSGLAVKYGVTVLNTPGTIERGLPRRGEDCSD